MHVQFVENHSQLKVTLQDMKGSIQVKNRMDVKYVIRISVKAFS